MVRRSILRIAAGHLVAAAIVFGGTQIAWADKNKILAEGKEDYTLHCAPCHGARGKGDGSMAALLIKPPANLQQIAKKNGGAFPFWKIYDIVAGRAEVAGHQTFQMPRFWQRFRGDQGKPGYLPAHIRILLLTHHLENLQQK